MTSCGPADLPTDGGFWVEPEDVRKIRQFTEMRFGWTEPVALPAWVYGFIANGDTFQIPSTDPSPETPLSWSCNVRGGTEVVFAVFTSGTYGDLGFLEPMVVGESLDDGCLANSSHGSMLGAGGGSSWGTRRQL